MRIAVFAHAGVTEFETRYSIPHIREFVELLSQNHEVTVYCANHYETESKEYRIGSAVVKYIFADPSRPHLPAPHVRIMHAEFTKDCRDRAFDIAHGIGALAGGVASCFAARLNRIPSVVTLIGGELASLPELDYGNMRRQPQRALTRFVCGQADSLVLLTEYQRKLLESQRIRTKRIEVIPFGVDEHRFQPSGEKRLEPPFNILHIGTQGALKGQETLLGAFLIVSDSLSCNLRIIGQDYFGGKIQQLVAQFDLGDRVEFIPYVPNSELPKHFQWAHLYLQTSLSEGQSLACTEAMASGTVIGGTSVGILDDLAPRTAFAVPTGDYIALAEKIMSTLSNPPEFHRLRTNGLEWSASHTAKAMVLKHEELYSSLVKRKAQC